MVKQCKLLYVCLYCIHHVRIFTRHSPKCWRKSINSSNLETGLKKLCINVMTLCNINNSVVVQRVPLPYVVRTLHRVYVYTINKNQFSFVYVVIQLRFNDSKAQESKYFTRRKSRHRRLDTYCRSRVVVYRILTIYFYFYILDSDRNLRTIVELVVTHFFFTFG